MQAEQKPAADQLRQFVINAHFNLEKTRQTLAENPALLNQAYKWNENDYETAIQAAAQIGSVHIIEFLLEKGAPLEICTVAVLGRRDELERRLDENPESAKAVGAHGIPLLPHVVWSNNLDLVRLVYERGGTTGANLALHNAIVKGNEGIVEWLIENAGADPNSKNYEGKPMLTVAKDRKNEKIIQLLEKLGARE
jgi:uncharacterized protein